MAEGGGGNDAKTNGDNPVIKSQMEVNECLGSWLTYLQMLNGLCSAGTKLAQSLQVLLSNHDAVLDCRLTGQCLAGWEELTRATGVASNTVKNHVVAALRDHEARDNDGDKHDILRDNLLTFINLQYQFCVACCECLGGIAECSCSQGGKTECDIAALQQCFERLYSPATPVSSSSIQQNCHRSPLRYPLFPLQVQRRWSETAAAEMSGESTESTMRRWSMPWDCRHINEWPRQEERSRLRVPHHDRSRSTTPDSVWKSSGMASQDGLQEAIQLLSCRPGVRPSNQLSVFNSQHVPGVILTTCSFETNYDGSVWPDSRRVGSPRCWPQDSHSSDHSDQSGHSGLSGDHRDSEHSGGSGSAGHRDSKDSIQSHSDHGSHRESEGGANVDLLPSRKNSSSAESCLSANSRSGSESAGAGEGAKSQLYSMWSGGDLPFIKLPESTELQDERPPTN
ncbi:uncharacterized protein LOC107047119 [Diachasma alloeum]|uniref:uncharacterized protein LOC107047119 n=1 Tax=Diachasma alloeum TaxID=454923 RepID=UPI00073833EC|nr:uncharacterized protein LOC107047119 [Diachasma alloeum]XP_015125344.1 uncharacterized protein LOC107047119 [Diachasma alloeum]XP_015125347.1 uncharacterized protein LOC107047119 [Diachasma alloeum]XP_015125350.1 uncharacterized protein LOC107047119 [Diachasma alloeum]